MARATKRRTKHRGNAAGVVESRGKTHKGGQPAKGGGKDGRRASIGQREPSWRGAFIRALVASAIFVGVMLLIGRRDQPVVTVGIGIMLLAVYTPFGYYTDRFFHRRRLAKAARTRAAGR